MKKLFIFICIVLLFATFAIPCVAEESKTEKPDVEITFADRLNEFINTYSGEIISGGSILTTISLIFVLWKKIKPQLLKIVGIIGESSGIQDKQSKAINSIIDGIEEIDIRMEKYEAMILGFSKIQGDTEGHFKEIQKSLVEIAKLLDTVYSNSKALPQDTKNLVHRAYGECIRIANDEIYGHQEVGESAKQG